MYMEKEISVSKIISSLIKSACYSRTGIKDEIGLINQAIAKPSQYRDIGLVD